MTFIEGTNDMATHDRNPQPPTPRIVLLLIPLIAGLVALGCDDSKPKPSGGMTAVDTAGGLPGLLGGLKPMMSMNPVMTPTNPVMTPMIPPGELTCAAFVKCGNDCPDNDAACYQSCQSRTSAKGRAEYDAVVACAKANMCSDSSCLQEKCAMVVGTCLGVVVQPPPPPPPPMTLTCEGIIKCWNGCPENDEACLDACLAKGSTKGRTDLNALLACGKTNMCQDSACLQQKCGPLFAACQSGTTPPPPPPSMTLTCEGIIKCWNGCPENDEACLDACLAKGSTKGRTDLNALLACGKTNMCQDSACLQQKCGPLFAACQSGTTPPPPPPTQLTCVGVFKCWDGCGDDKACGDACVDSASPKARADVKALVDCADANMCKDDACVEQKCAPQVTACEGGTTPPPPPPPPTMQLTCAGILKCIGACPANDKACVQTCGSKGSAMGLADLNALLDCNKTNMCQFASTCIQQKCAAQAAACAK
jgi:hypothetical protein